VARHCNVVRPLPQLAYRAWRCWGPEVWCILRDGVWQQRH